MNTGETWPAMVGFEHAAIHLKRYGIGTGSGQMVCKRLSPNPISTRTLWWQMGTRCYLVCYHTWPSMALCGHTLLQFPGSRMQVPAQCSGPQYQWNTSIPLNLHFKYGIKIFWQVCLATWIDQKAKVWKIVTLQHRSF